MNLVDALLAADADKITAKQTEDYEVKRLSKLLGCRLFYTCRKSSSAGLKSCRTWRQNGKRAVPRKWTTWNWP